MKAVFVAEDEELLLAGTAAELLAFAQELDVGGEVEFADGKRLTIAKSDAPLRILIGASMRFSLTGRTQELAASIRFLSAQESSGSIPPHLHVDWYPDHPYLDRDSVSLLVELHR